MSNCTIACAVIESAMIATTLLVSKVVSHGKFRAPYVRRTIGRRKISNNTEAGNEKKEIWWFHVSTKSRKRVKSFSSDSSDKNGNAAWPIGTQKKRIGNVISDVAKFTTTKLKCPIVVANLPVNKSCNSLIPKVLVRAGVSF